jgi:hypothetical protein
MQLQQLVEGDYRVLERRIFYSIIEYIYVGYIYYIAFGCWLNNFSLNKVKGKL